MPVLRILNNLARRACTGTRQGRIQMGKQSPVGLQRGLDDDVADGRLHITSRAIMPQANRFALISVNDLQLRVAGQAPDVNARRPD